MNAVSRFRLLANLILIITSFVATPSSASGATIRPLGLAFDDGRRQTLAHGISADGRVVAASSGSLRTWYY